MKNNEIEGDRLSQNVISTSSLHHTIIRFIIDRGYSPDVDMLAQLLEASNESISAALSRLQDDHGVVLHPNSNKVWVIHPFSLAPTNFLVRCGDQEWWGNCAWCSLGIAVLIGKDAVITTALGADGKQIDVHIKDGRVVETNFFVHFPVPMKKAWDNVIYTCSVMLLFESEQQIDNWCAKHQIGKGDVQPISRVWEFSQVWYGNHLDPDWRKWTNKEARKLFAEAGLEGEIWNIPFSESRF
jgi:hypothetical protein